MNPSFWTVLDTASWVLSVEALAIYPMVVYLAVHATVAVSAIYPMEEVLAIHSMEDHQQLLLEFLLEILSGILKVVLLDRKLVPESATSSPMVVHSAIYTTVAVSAIYSMEEVSANDAMEAASASDTMVASMEVSQLEG